MDNVKKYVDSENSLGPDMEATTALLVPNFGLHVEAGDVQVCS